MENIYDKKSIPNFEMEILAKGEHDVFLKQSFSIIEDEIHIFTDKTGFRRVEQGDIDSPLKLLEFLEKLCLSLKRAENYMFDCEKIKLELQSLYFNDKMKLAIEYEPKEDSENIWEKLSKLTYELPVQSSVCNDYIAMFRGKLRNNNSPDKLITATADMKREAYYCGYN